MPVVAFLGGCEDERASPSPSPQSSNVASPAPALDIGAFAYVGADGALWLRDEKGETRRIYAPGDGFVHYPEWSPNGDKIAFGIFPLGPDDLSQPTPQADIQSVVVIDERGKTSS